MGSDTSELATLAQSFCDLIERAHELDSAWLHDLALLLPQLHVAVDSLEEARGSGFPVVEEDLDTRFEIFSRLRRLLGANDGYWMEFDVAYDGQSMTGSLADDLTDIYCELKQGLSLWEQEPGLAVGGWHTGYRTHWGQHLVDASRHLYELNARNGKNC
jgi:hypothetical protein